LLNPSAKVVVAVIADPIAYRKRRYGLQVIEGIRSVLAGHALKVSEATYLYS
jgi:hypothetical protein